MRGLVRVGEEEVKTILASISEQKSASKVIVCRIKRGCACDTARAEVNGRFVDSTQALYG